MTRSVIDPITRIEGHLRAEMEVTDGVVTDAWISGGCFRGMELVVRDRTPEDAAFIVQRICGVCPVSHMHASSIAAEKAYGITIPNNARIIRNLIEGSQFLHSHILWFYNLAGLDYVNPLNALSADPVAAYDLATELGTPSADFVGLQDRLQKFADNGQLSIFSGNWFDTGEYNLTPEADLILTAHYLEALQMQAKASEIAGLLGGKMPHIMTIVPGGTAFVPTAEKLDDLKGLVDELYNWVASTLIPDTLAVAQFYPEAATFGKGCGRYGAWGVFERPFDASTSYTDQMNNRYLPAGVLDENFNLSDVDESKITEYVGRSWYEGDADLPPFEQGVHPAFTEYNVDDRYTWNKCPRYDGKPLETGGFARLLVAYARNVPFIVEQIDGLLEALGAQPGDLSALQNTLGRTGARQIETLYIAGLMKEWVTELCEAIEGGDSTYFEGPSQTTGEGTGFWEAPRGALYHSEKVKDGKITDYQIIIPSTWNLAPHDPEGNYGPMEQALIGVPVADIEKPINALRTVHSFDPCTACAVHIVEPKTGKKFETVTSPWGVK
ncbi:nickel-dependent hydrogenase large subunit [Slackia equolifaciens]|uniref:Nickel-dependent hydrogenase large subunit n=1 Tax=Slackia equolifaciens TaxID=498718 RepID=A0A3N0AY92_9ACTN|nr:nickel-dependent hydrogenase large subunit [Slackia equolifaciens]RNL39832.1 nickel-dependent hydrogenase large subunit [Slackia equolifaciens]